MGNEFIDGTLTVGKGITTASNSVVKATATVSSCTINNQVGQATTTILSNTGQSVFTLTVTNSTVTVGDLIMATLANGTNTTGLPILESAAAGAGVITFLIGNGATTATNAFGGTINVNFQVLKQ